MSCNLRSSEYGEGYVSDSPVKLLDQLMHGFKKLDKEEVVVLSQVPPLAIAACLPGTRPCAMPPAPAPCRTSSERQT